MTDRYKERVEAMYKNKSIMTSSALLELVEMLASDLGDLAAEVAELKARTTMEPAPVTATADVAEPPELPAAMLAVPPAVVVPPTLTPIEKASSGKKRKKNQ